jgi:hypothetical protein
VQLLSLSNRELSTIDNEHESGGLSLPADDRVAFDLPERQKGQKLYHLKFGELGHEANLSKKIYFGIFDLSVSNRQNFLVLCSCQASQLASFNADDTGSSCLILVGFHES